LGESKIAVAAMEGFSLKPYLYGTQAYYHEEIEDNGQISTSIGQAVLFTCSKDIF
jgi:hypothetical protein